MAKKNVSGFGKGNVVGSSVSNVGSSKAASSVSVRPSVESLGNSKFPRSSSVSRRNSGPNKPGAGNSMLNARMSRGQFGKAVVAGTAGLIGAGMFGSGVARANSIPMGPVPEWTLNNPYGYNWYVGKYSVDMGENLPVRPLCPPIDEAGNWVSMLDCHLSWPGVGPWNSILAAPYPDPDTITTGNISKRQLPDGRMEFTCNILVKGGPLTVFRSKDILDFRSAVYNWYNNGQIGAYPKWPAPILGATLKAPDLDPTDGANYDYNDGSIDYSLFARFVNPLWDPTTIYFILDYINGRIPGAKMESLAIQGTGTGHLTPYAANFPELQYYPGKIGTVHLPGTKAVGPKSVGDWDEAVVDESNLAIY